MAVLAIMLAGEHSAQEPGLGSYIGCAIDLRQVTELFVLQRPYL